MSVTAPAPEPIPASGRVVGLDLGSRRIGLAVSDGDQRVASPVTAVQRSAGSGVDRARLGRIVSEYEAVGVVAGLPRSLSGAIGPAARLALDELALLGPQLGVPVETVDERLTTVAAASALRAAGRPTRRQREVVDATAAALILQSWLDRRLAERARGAPGAARAGRAAGGGA